MLKQRERFVIDDPTSYEGRSYNYHVGFCLKDNDSMSLGSATVSLSKEVATGDDIDQLQDKLFKHVKKKRKKLQDLVVLGVLLLRE